MPAHATANSVIASANRLIDVRQSCLSSSRIAEISVPAWPIPIHQTKLTIAKPQATGMLMPQMPTPLTNSQVIADHQQHAAAANAIAKPMNHAGRASPRSSTMSLILSVTVRVGLPGARTRSPDQCRSVAAARQAVCLAWSSFDALLAPISGIRDCAAAPDTSCAAACSVRPAAHNCAAAPSASPPGCSGR